MKCLLNVAPVRVATFTIHAILMRSELAGCHCTLLISYISPTAGQTIYSTEPFNLTWVSGRYFEEESLNITVLLVHSPFTSTLNGITLVEGLVSPNAGVKTYSTELTPSYFYGDNETGTFDVVILETYLAYAHFNDATDVWIQTVNIV
ncbi:uncharacterized protein EV420DRAFT_1478677 [Desarmillaria tabescens]|uniref:Uncharacterized protein n=1 Tax=Armillaria tabescens TaxID=1929756 RepID=A0AA39KFI0_ARMTA|nr:uncharacterized protein EV420DRAFT_1478677 [Desarmillaria tabescens]KAK0460150.1 hypothetical protein EV420DRAFT_1478677 [Desarmillaria tabescens]